MYTRQEVKQFLELHCDFSNPEIVYVLLGVSRNKLNKSEQYISIFDKPKQKRVSRVLYKLDKVDDMLDEIEYLLHSTNYYIYVSANPRSIVKATTYLTHKLIDANLNKEYDYLKKTEGMWTSALMQNSSRFGRGLFMLDIDTKDDKMLKAIEELFEVKTLRETMNGYHALVKSFNPNNISLLETKYGLSKDFIEIKKDDFIFVNAHIKK